MSEITTAAELGGLPDMSVALDRRGVAWQLRGRLTNDPLWHAAKHGTLRYDSAALAERGPLTLLHRPDRPPQPTVQPSVEEVARAIYDCTDLNRAVLEDARDIAEAVLALIGGRTEAEVRADMLDHLIDRFYAADKNHFVLPYSVIDWLRHQPEYQARYGTDTARVEADHG